MYRFYEVNVFFNGGFLILFGEVVNDLWIKFFGGILFVLDYYVIGINCVLMVSVQYIVWIDLKVEYWLEELV